MSSRRVVVTGLGAVTPLGMSAAESWQALINGKSGVRSIELQVPNKAPLKGVAARLPRPIDDSKLTKLAINQRPVSQFIKYALASALMALEDACLLNDARLPDSIGDRCGVSIGSGIGGIDECVEAVNRVPRVSPFFVPRLLSNMAAGNVSIAFDLRGPNHSVATACAAGAHSIGDGMRFIQAGDADVMVVGGSEACISPLAISGFTRAKALTSCLDPQRASRPFDKERDGFVIGEGAGVLILEELEHARKRNARIYAELVGYGSSGDANHITAPPEDGNGAARCMRLALRNAQVHQTDIDYINAHATSTPLGDRAELRAIRNVFGNHVNNLSISSTKSSTGHLLGAAGAVEALFTILAIHDGITPPTLNLHNPDSEAEGLNLVALESQKRPSINYALTNSFGFGGTNASLVFKKWSE